MKIVASEQASAFIRENGGRLWVWLDPHRWMMESYIWLVTSTRPPGTTRSTQRMRSARMPHRFSTHEAEGFEVLFDPGRLTPPEELHLEVKGRSKRRRVMAYWNGFVFAGEDVPPPAG